MLRKNNRRPQPNPRDKRYKVVGRSTILRSDVFEGSATAARIRRAISKGKKV